MLYLRFILFLISPAIFANNNLGLPALIIPANNLQTPDKISLGQQIFNDPQFSKNGKISCASCHLKDLAFTDGKKTAAGISGLTGTRNAPTIVNAAFFETLFVDGRASSLEDQALQPMLNSIEHGLKSQHEILSIVLKNAHYKQQIQKIFKVSEAEISSQHIAKALASFERTLVSGNSKFDQYYFAQDRSQLSKSAARGLLIFKRKGNCANCHEISWNNALFTDNRFYNIGVGSKILQPIETELVTALKKSENYPLNNQEKSELGRFNVTHIIKDIGKFKTPTLRNIALTAPYMHDGSLATLEEVIEYYDKGGNKNLFLDPAIFPLHLTDEEKNDLVEFMKSLTSSEYLK
ncbi:MAG: cytochrome c peroxidase [Methyloprofundus sp.]|nr:cytochrome c peroxidase [Methyloprofundus sp.]